MLNFTKAASKPVVESYYYQPGVVSIPRAPQAIYVPNNAKTKRKWARQNAIFREFVEDNSETITKCFEFDWECSRLSTIVDESVEQRVKELLRKHYKEIKEAYKYLSSMGIAGDVWSIGKNQYTDVLQQIEIIDNDKLNLAACFIEWEATNFSAGKFKNNPKGCLVRFKWLEILVRLAVRRYFKSGDCLTIVDAVQLMLGSCSFEFLV